MLPARTMKLEQLHLIKRYNFQFGHSRSKPNGVNSDLSRSKLEKTD